MMSPIILHNQILKMRLRSQWCIFIVGEEQLGYLYRDHGATLRLGGGGTISDSILGKGTKHFFLLILYNFKNIGGGTCPPPPYSAVPVIIYSYNVDSALLVTEILAKN